MGGEEDQPSGTKQNELEKCANLVERPPNTPSFLYSNFQYIEDSVNKSKG